MTNFVLNLQKQYLIKWDGNQLVKKEIVYISDINKEISTELAKTKKETAKRKICVICNKPIEPEPITGWKNGCNAEPVKKGKCCKQCDDTIVIPARIEQHFKKNKASMIKSIGYRGED